MPPHSVHKAVVLLRRSDATNGCTIVLRGGGCGSDEGELSRLKRVIRRVALVAANCVYEKAFLIKEYAAPEIREGDGDAMNLDDVSLSPFITLEKVGWLACEGEEVLSCVIPSTMHCYFKRGASFLYFTSRPSFQDNFQPTSKESKKPREQVAFDKDKIDSAEQKMHTSSLHADADSASTKNSLAAFKASASERSTRVTKLQHDLIHNTRR